MDSYFNIHEGMGLLELHCIHIYFASELFEKYNVDSPRRAIRLKRLVVYLWISGQLNTSFSYVSFHLVILLLQISSNYLSLKSFFNVIFFKLFEGVFFILNLAKLSLHA